MNAGQDHEARKAALLATLQAGEAGGAPLGLHKRTSNLFRDRKESAKRRLDLGTFNHVLEVDPAEGWVDVEGLTTFEALVDQTLPHGVMPAVVPQLKTITVGGAAAGVGIEATSFRQGLVHDTLLALDVLLPSGDIVHCTPHNEHADLFHGFPNSYGTLGYALRLRMRTLPVRPFARVDHVRYSDPQVYFRDVGRACESDADFVDGVVFSPDSLILSTARFVDTAPWQSDYGYQHIYYRSLLHKTTDYLNVRDYLWRWDTDWFWCSKNVYAQNWLVRRLLGRERLNSRTYTRIMRWNARWGLTRALSRLRGDHPESVIQDVDIPIEHAPEFLAFLLREIGLLPIWICPVRPPQAQFTLYPLREGTRYVNFGFWDVVHSLAAHEPGHYNRLVEAEVLRLGGIKSLYSDSFFDRETFARAYNMAAYEPLKRKYDPGGRTLGLYEKVVLRA
jgi:FAD/FMN-containing dehydrogenase